MNETTYTLVHLSEYSVVVSNEKILREDYALFPDTNEIRIAPHDIDDSFFKKVVAQSKQVHEGLPLFVEDDEDGLTPDEKIIRSLFTLEDIKKAMQYGYSQGQTGTALFENQFISQIKSYELTPISSEGVMVFKRK